MALHFTILAWPWLPNAAHLSAKRSWATLNPGEGPHLGNPSYREQHPDMPDDDAHDAVAAVTFQASELAKPWLYRSERE